MFIVLSARPLRKKSVHKPQYKALYGYGFHIRPTGLFAVFR